MPQNEKEQSFEANEQITDEEQTETIIDLSSLTDDEKDALILEMQQQEIMGKKESSTTTIKVKGKIRKKRMFKKSSNASIAPGFGWIAIKMGTAMTLSMVFILLGPLLIFMALFKTFGERGVYDWYDLLWGLIGVGLVVTSIYLFRYIIKD